MPESRSTGRLQWLPRRIHRPFVLAVCAALLSGCISLPRDDPPPAGGQADVPGFPATIRRTVDTAFPSSWLRSPLEGLRTTPVDGVYDVLALSSGGAGGAFGAGALIGLAQAGERPVYERVTGVSTGALIAPFAFLGPAWDDDLAQAYTGSDAASLLQFRLRNTLFGTGTYDGRPLRRLVASFVSDRLVQEIAAASRSGRVLEIATTDLDAQRTVIWDVGAIARRGGSAARELMVDILVASASVPGVFPPVLIDVAAGGRRHQEMHVDGGTLLPFLVPPDLRARTSDSSPPADAPPGRVWVVINGPAAPDPRRTARNLYDIVSRSFQTMLGDTTRSELAVTLARVRHARMALRWTFVPSHFPYAGNFAFDREKMTALFEFGRDCARDGRLWQVVQTLPDGSVDADPVRREPCRAE